LTNPYYWSLHWRQLRAACLARDHHLCTVEGCRDTATIADHIETRPAVAHPTPADRLDNLRSLCVTHDAQVKERRSGLRKQSGEFRVKGSDAEGWPLDPKRR
jgi:5-methylcytosine-specific restriction endonuclease McrA